ncbi:MAG: hypothetical protein AB1938_03035 [Myxococcota bacterium]
MRALRWVVSGVGLSLAASCGCGGGPVPLLPDKVIGNCTYVNRFSQREECKDYVGEWDEKTATDDCKGNGSTIVLGSACDIEVRLGYCIFTKEKDVRYERITFPGDDASRCGPSQRGCEFFGGGVFDPSPVCGGVEPGAGGSGLPTFQPPVLTCKDPLPGEPPGKSANGQVCTWELISASTEEGRDFSNYASCDRVRTQRPYYGVPPAPDAAREDARMSDPAYVAELNWVKGQITASACVCCHSTRAPNGPSQWYLESPGNFMNSFFPRGIAMGAGWIDTVGFGAFDPADNNGFWRPTPDQPVGTMFPTTDPARMQRFFEAEAAFRGLKREDWTGQYGGGPLDTQRFYQPTACEQGEGVGADGVLTWTNGDARYVYVLEAGSANPTVPPNLDLPQGTLWRLDVPVEGTPLKSTKVTYGVIPAGVSQAFPPMNVPPTRLQSGKQYYLYVLADIGIPNTRCLFTAP